MSKLLGALAVLSLSAVLVPSLAGAADAGPPTDYRKVAGLSPAAFKDIEREVVRYKTTHDGTELYLEVVKPKGAQNLPVILEASPYHGTLADRDGTRILPDPKVNGKSIGLTGWFAPRGYAVVMMDLRGTGRSRGCLDHLGPLDGKDLKEVVEWAASQKWSNGKVGMTGHSYVGSTPMAAAAQNPKGLETIVPSAGLASMYDHQFQGGVPYFLQWAGPIEAYEQLALQRKAALAPANNSVTGNFGDDTTNGLPNNPQDTGCGLPNSAIVAGEDQLSGRYADWHKARDHRAGATAWDGSAFLVHGVNDNAARIPAADWFLARDNPDDKAWIGQWDHGSGVGPTRREMQFTYALTAWFDKQLKGRPVDTGPAAELFMSDSTFEAARTGARKWVVTSDEGWPGTSTPKAFFPSADNKMGGAAPADGSVAFSGDPRPFNSTSGTGGVSFVTDAFTESTVLAGMPKLRLSASVTAPRVHLIATLYDVRKDDVRRRITQCSINPELREGLTKLTPVIPTLRMDLNPPCMAMAHNMLPGHKLALRISTADPDKVPLFAADPRITVFTGKGATELTLPTVPGAVAYADSMPLK